MKHIILLLFAVVSAFSVSAQEMPYAMVVRASLVVGDTIRPEIPPRYPGGNDAFNEYLYKVVGNNTLNNGIERSTVLRATIQFTISETGEVCDVCEKDGVDNALLRVAIKEFCRMENWEPAYHSGKPVAVIVTVPLIIRYE